MTVVHRVAVASALLIAIPGTAFARPQFLEMFTRLYHPAAGTPLANARCQTCHTASGPPDLNPYGLSVHGTLDRAGMVTEAGLRSIEGEDSDGDGEVNGVEIAAGRLPGNPDVRVEGSAARRPDPSEQVHRTTGLVPEHTMHPLIVHFPIAMLIIGALLEILGARFRRNDLRAAGFLNFAIGSTLAPVVAATGITWALRAGFALKGILLLHFSCALATTACALTASLLHRSATRAGREADSALYWALIGAALVFISVTGHLGALMVHGW